MSATETTRPPAVQGYRLACGCELATRELCADAEALLRLVKACWNVEQRDGERRWVLVDPAAYRRHLPLLEAHWAAPPVREPETAPACACGGDGLPGGCAGCGAVYEPDERPVGRHGARGAYHASLHGKTGHLRHLGALGDDLRRALFGALTGRREPRSETGATPEDYRQALTQLERHEATCPCPEEGCTLERRARRMLAPVEVETREAIAA